MQLKDILARMEVTMAKACSGEALAKEMRRAEGERARQLDRVLEQIGVPERERCIFRAGHRETPAVREVRDWAAANNSWCLVLAGPTGVGKTVAAAAWLIDWAKDMEPHPSLNQRWYDAGEFGALDAYSEEFRRLPKLRYFVLDDLGGEYQDQYGACATKIGRLIKGRHSGRMRTIITTNLRREEFVARYDERIVERLQEGVRWRNIIGKSLRRKTPIDEPGNIPELSMQPARPEKPAEATRAPNRQPGRAGQPKRHRAPHSA